MGYKVGQTLDTLPEQVHFNSGVPKVSIFETEGYADILTASPGKWVVLDIMDDRKKSNFHSRQNHYNKKYNSKGFEFRRILQPTNQLFMGRYNPDLLS